MTIEVEGKVDHSIKLENLHIQIGKENNTDEKFTLSERTTTFARIR